MLVDNVQQVQYDMTTLNKSLKTMTKDEWIAKRQENSEFTWDEILASGYDAMPCSCNLKGCLGWKLLKVQSSFVPVQKKVCLVNQTPPEAA